MTDREKREKVIAGLKCRSKIKPDNRCERCHYGMMLGNRLGCNYMEICKDALALLEALDVTPEELDRLKLCRHNCKIDCLLESYNRVVDERDALLKAQEPVKPTLENGNDGEDIFCCGQCGSAVGFEEFETPVIVTVRYNYCAECGQAVKWDG